MPATGRRRSGGWARPASRRQPEGAHGCWALACKSRSSHLHLGLHSSRVPLSSEQRRHVKATEAKRSSRVSDADVDAAALHVACKRRELRGAAAAALSHGTTLAVCRAAAAAPQRLGRRMVSQDSRHAVVAAPRRPAQHDGISTAGSGGGAGRNQVRMQHRAAGAAASPWASTTSALPAQAGAHSGLPSLPAGLAPHLRSSRAVGGTSLVSDPIRKMAGQPSDRLTSGWCRQRSASSMWPFSVSPASAGGDRVEGSVGWPAAR